jgi:DNA-binding transcriptional ArsR family regulator
LTHQPFLVYTPVVSPAALSPDLSRAARLFHALSDETRLGILEMLRGGERCVCDLQADLDAAQSRLSFHLKVLREAGLVTDRKEGTVVVLLRRPGGAGRGARRDGGPRPGAGRRPPGAPALPRALLRLTA